MAYVYRHIRLDTMLPFYIGIGQAKSHNRAKTHHGRNKHWHNVVNKAGFDFEILFDDISIELAKEKEIEFIKIYGRINKGDGILVNQTDGGDGMYGWVATSEFRKKMRDIALKRKITDDWLTKRRANLKKREPYTPERSKEIGLKISASLKGIKQPNHVIELLKKRTGENNPMYGNHNSKKGMIIAYKEGVAIGSFNGVYVCAKALNVTATKISACLNGRRNKTGGYVFKRDKISKSTNE